MRLLNKHDAGAVTAAVFLGALLLLSQALRALFADAPPDQRPLALVCEQARLTLVNANANAAIGPTNAAADPSCQPFVARMIAINQADERALTTIPGIGAATATKIARDRERYGKFRSADDLTRVPGIGVAKAKRFAAYLSFE
ncbi:MAG: helix-hairpin-helix domain-containing protein [Desulfobulbaceae bacterium]|jgi:competence ComEA-like helix-hairpin-helix protein|nr:helix-hairpin-helix domain-containing protein [Desulfobulbaceae bacterium]